MTVSEQTDEQLMHATARSDNHAFQELLRRYSQKVFSLAWRFCSDKTEAEDLTQEVFFKVWRNAQSWQPQAKLETWLYRILYNLFIDNRRRTKTQTEQINEKMQSHDDTPEQTLIKKRELMEIEQAFNSLPDRQKEALILCYYQGLKAKEAADILSVSQGALESLLFRARQTLKEKLLNKNQGGDR